MIDYSKVKSANILGDVAVAKLFALTVTSFRTCSVNCYFVDNGQVFSCVVVCSVNVEPHTQHSINS